MPSVCQGKNTKFTEISYLLPLPVYLIACFVSCVLMFLFIIVIVCFHQFFFSSDSEACQHAVVARVVASAKRCRERSRGHRVHAA